MIIIQKENFVMSLGPRNTIFKLLWMSNCGTQNLFKGINSFFSPLGRVRNS